MLTARVSEGQRILLCGKGEQYSARATGSFVLFVYVVVASAPERSLLVSVTKVTKYGQGPYYVHNL